MCHLKKVKTFKATNHLVELLFAFGAVLECAAKRLPEIDLVREYKLMICLSLRSNWSFYFEVTMNSIKFTFETSEMIFFSIKAPCFERAFTLEHCMTYMYIMI